MLGATALKELAMRSLGKRQASGVRDRKHWFTGNTRVEQNSRADGGVPLTVECDNTIMPSSA